MIFSFQILSFILATLLCFRHRRERSSFLRMTARCSFDPCAGRSCVWGDDLEWLPLSGCGTQHPHRALGGTCVLLAAAPTTPPCFRHWRRSSSLHSSHLQRKDYFYFAFVAACGPLQTLFSREGSWREAAFAAPLSAKARRCGESTAWRKRAELPQSKPDGFDSSLWEGASGASGHFAL